MLEEKAMKMYFQPRKLFLSSYYNLFTDDDNYWDRKPFSSKIGMKLPSQTTVSLGF